MLSDARHMTGGETVPKAGNGDVLLVKAPQMVSYSLHRYSRTSDLIIMTPVV